VLPRSARNTRKEPEGRGRRAGCRTNRTAPHVARERTNGSTSGTMRRADAAVCETPGSVELPRETSRKGGPSGRGFLRECAGNTRLKQRPVPEV